MEHRHLLLGRHEHQAVAGIIASRDPLGRAFATRWVLLAWPRGDGGSHLAGFRPSGVQAFAGEIDGTRSKGTFSLWSVPGQGNLAVAVEGVIAGGRPAITEAWVAREIRTRGAPAPVVE